MANEYWYYVSENNGMLWLILWKIFQHNSQSLYDISLDSVLPLLFQTVKIILKAFREKSWFSFCWKSVHKVYDTPIQA